MKRNYRAEIIKRATAIQPPQLEWFNPEWGANEATKEGLRNLNKSIEFMNSLNNIDKNSLTEVERRQIHDKLLILQRQFDKIKANVKYV